MNKEVTGTSKVRLICSMIRHSENGLFGRICGLVVRTLDLPVDILPLHADSRLYGTGINFDSLDALRLVAALEEEFDITIDDSEVTPETFESVKSIAFLVQNKQVSHS